MDKTHRIIQLGIGTRTGWIDVFPHSTTKQEGILGNDGETAPDGLETKISKIPSIDFDLPFTQLDRPEEGLRDRAFASTGSTNDTDLLPWPDIECETLQNQREVRAVAKLDIVERHSSSGRPGLIRFWIVGKVVGRFGFELSVVLNAFHTVLLVSLARLGVTLTILC
jgi:hypothetical protein